LLENLNHLRTERSEKIKYFYNSLVFKFFFMFLSGLGGFVKASTVLILEFK